MRTAGFRSVLATLVLQGLMQQAAAVGEADFVAFGRLAGDAVLFRPGSVKLTSTIIPFSVPFFGDQYV